VISSACLEGAKNYRSVFIYSRLIYCWDTGNGVGLAVNVGMAVSVKGKAVGVGGTGVSLGMGVSVKGKAVSVSGSVGYGVTVLPGMGVPGISVGYGVRVAILGTQSVSPG
jgi:hypothetical protein